MEMDTEKPKRMMQCTQSGCGRWVEWRPKRKYCIECGNNIHKKDNKIYVAKNGRKPKKSHGGKVVCKCPACGKLHKLKLNWTGNGTPRKYCESCLLSEASQAGILS